VKEVKFPKIPQKIIVLLLLVVIGGSIPLTLFLVQQAQIFQQNAWFTTQAAQAICSTSDSSAVIQVTFTNTERSKAMDVVAKDLQTGKKVDLGTIKADETKKATIVTGEKALLGGSVLFSLSWSDGSSGTDTRTAIYQAVNNCAGPSPTPPPACIDNQGYCRWDLLDNAVSYDVTVRESKTDHIVKQETIASPASQSAFLMEKDKAYYCTVKGNNACGSGDAGKSPDKTCLMSPPSPTPTPPVCVPSDHLNEANCTWDALEGAIDYNIVIIDTDSKKIIKSDTVKAPQTNYPFPAEAGKSYQCSVTGANACGTGGSGKGEHTCPLPSSSPTPTTIPSGTPPPTPTPSPTPTPTPTKAPTPTTPPLPTPTPITIVRTVTRTITKTNQVNTNTQTNTNTNTNTQTQTNSQQQVGQQQQTIIAQSSPRPTIAATGSVTATAAVTVASVGLIVLGTLLVFIF